MCKCNECNQPLEQGFFSMKVAEVTLKFHPRCLPKAYYEEYPDRRKEDQMNLPFEDRRINNGT